MKHFNSSSSNNIAGAIIPFKGNGNKPQPAPTPPPAPGGIGGAK